MKFFFERAETESEVIVTYNSYFLYLVLGLLTVSYVAKYFGAPDEVGMVFSLVMLAVVLWRTVNIPGVKKEIRAAMRAGCGIRMSGSQFNIRNPYTVRISKMS